MHAIRLFACLGLIAAAFGVSARAGELVSPESRPAAELEQERNVWPAFVEQGHPKDSPSHWVSLGPLLFGQVSDTGESVGGVRPLWYEKRDSHGEFRAGYFLYPLFSYRSDEHTYQWNVFELVRHSGPRSDVPGPLSQFETGRKFEIWPFWFSRTTRAPETSYQALFPIVGTVRKKLTFERASWFLFPVYFQSEERGVRRTQVPWPIVRVTTGAAHGFGIWPLFEVRERPGMWKRQTYLWPLGYNNTTYPAADAPAGTPPTRDVGALPFYARHTGPGLKGETFVWPFFGYTDRVQPTRYHETRYLWPLLVQGRGDDHYVNRWGPVYTHSVIKGYDKTWFVWPVLRHAEWKDRGLEVTKTQVFYFIFWSEEQRSLAHPEKQAATLTHLWPLYSSWDNGAGRQQVQLFSPLEVFFQGNEKVQTAWSPFFAIARREQTAPGESRTSLLWNAVTWRRSDSRQEREFHVGPLFSVTTRRDDERIAIGNGLISFRRDANAGWKIHWLDFPSKSAKAAIQPR